ncbi:MAG: hypothetical protein D3916_13380 [Candidatus Electrothrix sp. MAN1_4]|nr:hypothetical protein [Candidatus Electrothrix sp. MAN1_4]
MEAGEAGAGGVEVFRHDAGSPFAVINALPCLQGLSGTGYHLCHGAAMSLLCGQYLNEQVR